jgi:hypothetical protein
MLSITLACLWVLIATAIALTRCRYHWPAAYALIASGIPIVGYVTFQDGPVLGMIVLGCGASMLRWPVRFATRWLVRRMRGRPGGAE